jgi:hypothetical protein
MTASEKLMHDIESLKATLQLDWIGLSKSLTSAERRNIRRQINSSWIEMKKLRNLLKGPQPAEDDSDAATVEHA